MTLFKREKMKLSALMTILTAQGEKMPRRPALIMNREYDLTGRMSLNQDRFIFQFPQCQDMNCGKSAQEIKVSNEVKFS